MTAAPISVKNPFPGLRPFREDEEHLFFGRESQVDAMVDKLAATRFLAVVGTSGGGKSSLVNCGLRPALHRGQMASAGTAWRVAQFRPGRNPVRAMARALAADGVLFTGFRPEGVALDELVEATLRMSNLGLADVYEQAQPAGDVNLLVVADQFEELFRFRPTGMHKPGADSGGSQEAMAFVNLLLAPKAQAGLPIYVVLTMRSDFLGDCTQYPGLAEAINAGQYLVPRLSRDERRAAIAGPVSVGGAKISPVLLTRVLNDVGDNPDQLSILQHALNRTWSRWQHEGKREGEVGLTHYESIGAMAHALNEHADKAFDELKGEREQKICEKIFKALTDKGTDPRGIRRPTSLSTLAAISGATTDEVITVIDVFRKPSRSFLMPPVPEKLEPDTIIDISHETLMRVWERLVRWADDEAASSRRYLRLAETAALYEKHEAGLWGDPDLQRALDWRESEKPTAVWAELYGGGFDSAMAFLEKSKEARDREIAKLEFNRRWRVPNYIILGAMFVTHELWEELGPNLSGNLQAAIADLIHSSRLAKVVISMAEFVPWILAYFAVASLGKRIFRCYAFERVVSDIAGTGPAVEARYAPFWRRLVAGLIDSVIFLGIVTGALVGFVALEVHKHLFKGLDFDVLLIVIPLLLYVAEWIVQAVLIARGKASLGKMVMSLQVLDTAGKSVSFKRASARYFAQTVFGVLALGAGLLVAAVQQLAVAFVFVLILAIGFGIALFTNRKQTLYDMVSSTVVWYQPKMKKRLALSV